MLILLIVDLLDRIEQYECALIGFDRIGNMH